MLEPQIYYDAVVISDEIDPNRAGAVRARIIGVTDEFEDKDQPFVLPTVNSIMAVPTKGTYLRVEFEDGDINQGRYLSWSPEKRPLPEEYVAQYPNVAVANLGGDLFQMTHNRASRSTVITHPSLSTITWDDNGRITHDSDLGYGNAGKGAKEGTGTKIQPVLTGGTIDVFCCTPHGLGQGSEYMHITHVSQNTVLTPPPTPPTTQDTAVLETGQTKPFNDGEIEFLESPSRMRSSSRSVDYLLIGITGDDDFTTPTLEYSDSTTNSSVHYLVGKAATGAPEPSSGLEIPVELPGGSRDADESSVTANGFVQFVDINESAMFAGNEEYEGKPLNQTCVSAMVVGTGELSLTDPLTPAITPYQYGMLGDILKHVRATFGDHVQVITTDDIGLSGAPEMDNFDVGRVVAD